jgi:hypothetical protein
MTDRGTFDADVVEFAGIGTVDGDLIIGRIPILNPQVINMKINVQEWEDELIFYVIPNYTRHLIPQYIHHWTSYTNI